MFLGLEIPDDDPLRPAKNFVSTAAPGVRIFEKGESIDWESDYIWLVIINEEDGLDFKIKQTTDGTREIQAFWNEQELGDTCKIRELLEEDPAWDIFQLRATVLLQDCVEMQIETNRVAQIHTQQTSIRDVPWRLAERLRSLELAMLERTALLLNGQVRRPGFLYPAICTASSTCRCMVRPMDFRTQVLRKTVVDLVGPGLEPWHEHAFDV
jgi:hypothetical protein